MFYSSLNVDEGPIVLMTDLRRNLVTEGVGKKSESRIQNSEVRGQNSEFRIQKSEWEPGLPGDGWGRQFWILASEFWILSQTFVATGQDAPMATSWEGSRWEQLSGGDTGRDDGGQDQGVLIVIHRREPICAAHVLDIDAERAAIVGIDRELGDELAARVELDDLAGLVGIHVVAVTVGHQQVSVGSQHQIQRPMQVSVVLVDHRVASSRGQRAREIDGPDGVVG